MLRVPILMTVSRYDFRHDLYLGPDWRIPLPLSGPEKPFSYLNREKTVPAPGFASDAAISVKRLLKKERDGNRHDVYEVSFPPVHASGGRPRANDYEVSVSVVRHGIERTASEKRVYSRHYMFAESMDVEPVVCDFEAASLPADAPLSFTVSPLNAYGGKGDSIRLLLSPSELARLRKV